MRGKKAPKCRTCVKRFIADALLCTWQLFVLISRNVHHLVGGFELSCLRVINFLKNRVINKMEWRKILCKFNSAYTQYWRQYSYKVHRFVADEDLPACFYHTRAESARLSRKQRTPHNNQVKLKLKQMWNSSYCARARAITNAPPAKIRDSLGQFTINVIKCNCISSSIHRAIIAEAAHSFSIAWNHAHCWAARAVAVFNMNAFPQVCLFLCFKRNACSIGAIYAPYYDYLCDLKLK